MSRKNIILWIFIVAKFVIHLFLISPEYDLHRDEYLHLDQGKHLAWGYISVAPFTSWISLLISWLGNSVFWVKFFPVLFGILTMVIVWKAIEALGGGLFAMILGATAITFSAVMRINILYQPNSADILFWTLLYFLLLEYIQTAQTKWIYALGLTLGLGFLNKYNIIFQVIGLIPALLLSEQRKIFQNKHLYFAGAIALVIVLPNLWWQYENHFPVVYHMRLLSKTQLVNVNRADFLKEQVLFFLGSVFILLAAFVALLSYQPFRKFRFFFWAFVFTLSLFTYLRAKSYYAIGLHPIFLSFGAVYLEHILVNRLFWLRYAAILIVLVLFIPILRIGFPINSPAYIADHAKPYQRFGLLRWEDGKDHALPQDFADMQGWRELAQKVDDVYSKIPDKKHTLVLCDNYGQAGAINFYSEYKDIQAVTMNADYINWFPIDEEIVNVILIQNADDTDPDRNKEKPLFKRIKRTGRIENPFAREVGTSIYALLDARTSINAILRDDIRQEKAEQE